jgi:branched-chain amino acid transport system permease protein
MSENRTEAALGAVVIAGAVALQALSTSTRFIAQWTELPSDLIANLRLALVGIVLVAMIVLRPQGGDV